MASHYDSTRASGKSVNPLIQEGMLLACRYEVQKILGKGNFGFVTKCLDYVTCTTVAIKIMKDKPDINSQELEEIKILKELQTMNPKKWHIVKLNGWFWHDKFTCLNFELLDLNLHKYMELRNFMPLTMAEIRSVLHQLNTALSLLQDLRIIHRDIKPENIMVVDRRRQPVELRLIDFGYACHVSNSAQRSYVQTRWYRAPEVMLGLSHDKSMDMWSLGVVMGELALGYPLFPGRHEYDMIKYIVDTLGQPPSHQLEAAEKSNMYFNNKGRNWTLKTPREFATITGHQYKDNRCFNTLCGLEKTMHSKHQTEKTETCLFIDLLKKMLLVDRFGRILPKTVEEHPFFFAEQHRHSSSNTNMTNLAKNMHEPNFQPAIIQPKLE